MPPRIRQSLAVEAGLNDGLAVPFLMLFIVLAIAEETLGPRVQFSPVSSENSLATAP